MSLHGDCEYSGGHRVRGPELYLYLNQFRRENFMHNIIFYSASSIVL